MQSSEKASLQKDRNGEFVSRISHSGSRSLLTEESCNRKVRHLGNAGIDYFNTGHILISMVF